jgi:hypothetical protein
VVAKYEVRKLVLGNTLATTSQEIQ